MWVELVAIPGLESTGVRFPDAFTRGWRASSLAMVGILLTACAGTSTTAAVRSPSVVSMPSPDPTQCGSWTEVTSATGALMTQRYGEIRNCAALDSQRSSWMMTTLGTKTSHGVIAIYRCGTDACRDGRTDHPVAGWTIFPGPHVGGVTLLGMPSPAVLIVDNGGYQMTFDLLSDTYLS